MARAFPNQLDQKVVIQLANEVVPDASTMYKSNPYMGQFGNQMHPMYNQNMANAFQPYWDNGGQEMYYPRYIPCPCFFWVRYPG